MDLQRNIDIGIGSQTAKIGASKVRAALDSIKRKSKQVAASSARDSKKMGSGFKTAAKAALALAGVFAAKSLVGSTKDFGQAVADLSAITGAVGEDLDFLRRKSKEFGETTTLSATQAAEAFKVIASAKPDLLENVDALSLVTEEAIALAEATGESLPSAANAMASALNQFGEGADQASRFINVLAAGSKRGAALVGEMAESLKMVGIIASQASLSFEQTNAALQLLSTRALKGSEAGMQMRGVLLALTASGKDSFKPEVVGLSQALENLANAGLDQGSAALKLFGRRNLAAAKTLIQNRDALGKLTGQLTGSNIAYEQQARRIDTLHGDSLALKSAYEGLELTIGAELEPTLRALTKAATENIREMARNPLLQKRTAAVLDTIHRALDDIRLMFMQIKSAVTLAGGGAAVFEGAWGSAIDNIVKWTKFLWEQFVVGGPANLKLGITLMIAFFDKLRIDVTQIVRNLTIKMLSLVDIFVATAVEKFKLISPTVQLVFQTMANVVGRTFDNIIVSVATAIDGIIGIVQQKIFGVSRTLASLGFDDRAREMTDIGIAIGKMATNTEKAEAAAKANETARLAEIDAIEKVLITIRDEAEEKRKLARETADALIRETVETAAVQRAASNEAVQGAIAERDATIEAIKALRKKRAEIFAASGGIEDPEKLPLGPDLSAPADDASDAYENLGDVQKRVVDGMADGIADMAASGKADFADLARSIIKDIIQIYIKSQLLNALSKWFGNMGDGGTISEVSVTPATRSTTFAGGGQHGLDFTVGGNGGTDSQRVVFNATPGELVSVRTPGQVQSVQKATEELRTKAAEKQTTVEQQSGLARAPAAVSELSIKERITKAVIPTINKVFNSTVTNELSRMVGQTLGPSLGIPAMPVPVVVAPSPGLQAVENIRKPERTRPAATFPGFATGGDFMVDGAGGTDSQLVAFRATPGEEVSVKTPSQQRLQGGGVTIKQTNVIDARGADAERIEAILPRLMEENRQRTLADVIALRDKGVLRK